MDTGSNNKYEWGDGVFTLLSWFRKEKVKNARVLVIGAGALGNEVVKDLALFGVGHIYVVDFDRIEITNLTRSILFREEDAFNHLYKAEVVARRAMEINPQIQVVPIVGNLFSDVGLGLYRAVDVVIGCLDSRIARYQLNRLCLRAGKKWIDGGIENMSGNVRVFSPGVNCYECGLSREEFNHIMLRTGCADVVRLQEQAGRVATTPISASIIGAMQVQEAMKIIHQDANEPTPFKTLEGRMLRYEGLLNTMKIYKYAAWKNTCMAHEYWKEVVAGENLSATMSVGDFLAALRSLLDVQSVEINMRNNKFVEKIIAEKTEEEFQVMIPESRLDEYINKHSELRRLSYKTVFQKLYDENIDADFPYQELTLEEIGIPLFDVLQISCEKGMFYVELTGDASHFL